MAVKIDEETARTYPAPAKGSAALYDTDVSGFVLRVYAPTKRNPKGERTFFLYYLIEGRKDWIKIGRFPEWTARAARDRAKELRRMVDRGEDPAKDRRDARNAPTVRELAERYEREHLPRKVAQSRLNDMGMIRNEILPFIGDRKVSEIHQGDIADLLRRITDRGAPIRANRVRSVASKMFELALRPMAGETTAWRSAAQGNPCRGVERNVEEGKERFFSSVEIAAITDALDAYGTTSAANCLRLMMLTGCRPGEAMRATWAEFSETRVWDKPSAHTKQKKRHRVPLSPGAVELVERLRDAKEEGAVYIFPGQKAGTHLRQIRTAWEAVVDKASIALWSQSSDRKIAKLVADLGDLASVQLCQAEAKRRGVALPVALMDARAYDLRHTFASIGAGGGLSLQIIGKLLGHTQARTTQRYAHLADDPLREAANKIGGAIAGAGKPAAVVPIRGARDDN